MPSTVEARIEKAEGLIRSLISRINGLVSGVSSVFSRTGAVTAATNDYTWAQIDKATSSIADITTRAISDTTGTLAIARGGTENTTQQAALNALAPATPATGDIMYYDGTNWIRLARGSDNQVLTATATTINWEAAAGGGSTLTQQNIVSAKNGNDSTTSTTFVDVPGATATFTPSSGTNNNVIHWTSTNANNGTANRVFFTLDVDGTDDNEWDRHQNVADYNTVTHVHWNRANLTAASHTLKIQMRVGAGTLSIIDVAATFHYFTIQTFV